MARRNNVIRYSRDYRRSRKFDMGLPKHKPPKPHGPLSGKGIKVILLLLFAIVIYGPLGDTLNGWIKPHKGCRVTKIIDGDTIRMNCPVGGEQSGRLLGFDTPELFSPKCLSETISALSATYYLRWLLFSAGEISALPNGEDRYGRTLTRLLVDGEPIAEKMINAGHARAYDGGIRTGWCT